MILIISDINDRSTHDVINILKVRNVKFFLITKEVELDVFINININCIIFESEGIKFSLDQVNVVWYRRGFINLKSYSHYNNDEKRLVKVFSNDLNAEKRKVLDFIYYKIENINSIGKFTHNHLNKLEILDRANKIGLDIPYTIVTGSKERVKSFYDNSNKNIITKPIYEVPRNITGSYRYIYNTEKIEQSLISKYKDSFNLSLFQNYISKALELRIFLLDNKLYTMAMFSQQTKNSIIDYRAYNFKDPYKCVPFTLPKKVTKKLLKLSTFYNFNGGSFDLILTPFNKYIFLEYNPVGQFGMVSFPCNFNLELKIAEYLIENSSGN